MPAMRPALGARRDAGLAPDAAGGVDEEFVVGGGRHEHRDPNTEMEGNIQHPTSNTQHPMAAQTTLIGCSMLDVGCWMFSFIAFSICFRLPPSPPGTRRLCIPESSRSGP